MSTTVNLSEAVKYIESNINLQLKNAPMNRPTSIIYLSGSPGVGKSSLMEQVAKKLDISLNVKYLSTMLIEQISGLPIPASSDQKEYYWSKPELFSEDHLKIKSNGPNTILFLDDAHLCCKSIQNYLFQLLTYKSIHNHKLSDNYVIVLAGNKSTDSAGAQPIMSPIVNRLLFVDVVTTVESWVNDFAITYGVRQDVMSFLGLYPDLLQSPPLESAPFASPRSWTHYSDSLDQLESKGRLSTSDYLILGHGHIGEDYAGKFVEYVKLFMRWNAEEFLSGKTPIPDLTSMSKIDSYTLMSAIIAEFMKTLKTNNYDMKNEKIVNEIKIVKKLFDNLTLACKEIIPLGLRTIIVSEAAKAKTALVYYELIKGNNQLLEVAKKLLSVGK